MLTREEERKLREVIAETEKEAKRAKEEAKRKTEKAKEAKEAGKKAGLSDRKPSRFAVASFVIESKFFETPRTVEEYDRETLRVAVANGLKANANETATVRKAVLNVLLANGTVRISDGKIVRPELPAKKTA